MNSLFSRKFGTSAGGGHGHHHHAQPEPKMGHNDYAKLDKHIEEWAHYRENTHRYFRVTPKHAFQGFIMLAVVPYFLHKAVKKFSTYANKNSQFSNPFIEEVN